MRGNAIIFFLLKNEMKRDILVVTKQQPITHEHKDGVKGICTGEVYPSACLGIAPSAQRLFGRSNQIDRSIRSLAAFCQNLLAHPMPSIMHDWLLLRVAVEPHAGLTTIVPSPGSCEARDVSQALCTTDIHNRD